MGRALGVLIGLMVLTASPTVPLMVLVQVHVYETFDPVYQDLAAMRWPFGIR